MLSNSLKHIDVKAMSELGSRLNLIPVIAKADTLTPEEMIVMKTKVREQIARHNIRVYAPEVQSDDEETTKRNRDMVAAIPFSVIGSEDDHVIGSDGQPVVGRQYSWGIAEVENDTHCDFKKLRSLLLRTHLLDLIMSTNEVHYEKFRDAKLAAGGLSAGMTPEKYGE